MNSPQFLLPIIGILAGSQAASWFSHRLNLPTVFGTLLLGLLLGPSVWGWIVPSESLANLSQIGVLILMFLAGLETDMAAMQKLGRAALLSAVGGVILPFIGGTVLSLAFGLALLPSLFVGTILTATSVSITARTLQELGHLQTREGTVILGAAVIDDVLGILVLSLIIGLHGGGDGLLAITKMIVFFPLALAAGYWIMPKVAQWVKAWHHPEAGLAIVMAVVLLYAWSAEAFAGMAAVTGAYLAGVLIGRTDIKEHAHRGASTLGYAFFVPLFFVSIGLETHARSLGAMPVFTILLVAIAIVTKVIGCALGARVGGCSRIESVRVGVGMISRGEVALVVATLGLQAHVIDEALFAMAVVMTLVTTILTPLLLKGVYLSGAKAGAARISAQPSALIVGE